MKVIFFPVFQGVVARNLLRTDFFARLIAREDIRVVIIVGSEEKRKYLSHEFSSEKIVFEVVEKYKTPSFQAVFTFLKYNLLNTRRMDIRRKIYLHESKNILGYVFKLAFNRIFARKSFRSFVRKIDFLLVRDVNYVDLFKKYEPSLVISAHPFGDNEASLLRQAKKRGVTTLAIINSWDKLTSRSMLRILPDKMIVHNEIIKKEAKSHADMNEENIAVIGVPHYDIFINGKPRSRESFCSKFNIDQDKKIVLFCPTGQYYSKNDVEILRGLIDLNESGKLGPRIQIFVRFPPNDTVIIPPDLARKNVIFYQPGIRFDSKRGVDWDMNNEDIQLLFDNIHWSSVIICPPSSLSIDAAILDRPVINTKFGDDKSFSTDNINLYYESDHYLEILKHDGIKLVKNMEELAEGIRQYINDPSLDKDGRRAIANEQCYKLDGQSSIRLYQVVAHELENA